MSRTLLCLALAVAGFTLGAALAGAVLWPQLSAARRAAGTDELTGLANRRTLTAHLRVAVRRSAPITVALLDLDKFKTVNDTYGHAIGDLLLQAVAQRLDRPDTPVRLAARLAGDEFVLLIDGDSHTAYAAVSAVCQAIALPIHTAGRTLHVRASAGMASSRPGLSERHLMHHADLAMYAAKTAPGAIRTYAHQPGTEITERPPMRCRDRRRA